MFVELDTIFIGAHLKQHFGFKDDVLSGRDKDGGFDILWLVPLGADGYRSVFSIQCKNGKFRDEDAAKSVADAERSLHKHGGILDRGHVSCVVFNDYLEMSSQFKRGVSYIPVGISDLLRVSVPQDVQVL